MGDQETLDEFVAKKAEDGRLNFLEKSAIRSKTRKLTDVNVNLAYARMAVSFVKQKVPLVANWDEPLPTSFESIIRGMDTANSQAEADRVLAKAKAARDKADKCVYDNLRPDPKWERIYDARGVRKLQDIQILSDLADQHGCGNCMELTAVTFMYLYNLDIGPLDFMALVHADHAFVVIGRRESDDVESLGRNWDKSAVVCDPWAYGLNISFDWPFSHARIPFGDSFAAYSAVLLEQKMNAMHPRFSGVTVSHREP